MPVIQDSGWRAMTTATLFWYAALRSSRTHGNMCFRSSVIFSCPTLARSVRRKFVPVFMTPRIRTWLWFPRFQARVIGARQA